MAEIVNKISDEGIEIIIDGLTQNGYMRQDGESDIDFVTRWSRDNINSYITSHHVKMTIQNIQINSKVLAE